MKNDSQASQASSSQIEEPIQIESGQESTASTTPSWMNKINQASAVASSPQQKQVILLLFLALIAAVIYYTIFGYTPSPTELKAKEEQNLAQKKEAVVKSATPVTAPVLTSQITPQSVDLPSSAQPQLQAPTPPPPPVAPLPVAPAAIFTPAAITPPPTAELSKQQPSPPSAPNTDLSYDSLNNSNLLKTDSEKEAEQERTKLQKRNSSIIVFGGGGRETDAASGKDEHKKEDSKTSATSSSSGFLGFGNGNFDNASVAKTATAQVSATTVGNTDNLILQGKIMTAVLETAINTDLPGTLRAVITRDVYAESGKRVLIPKGSRAIGSYEHTVGSGQTRVKVTWSRLVRPDGIDIGVNSVGTDNLGRAGIVGKVDNKLWTQLGAALLVSYIIPNIANKVSGTADQALTQSAVTNNGVTTSTSSGTATTVSASTATGQFTNTAQNIINSAFPSQPTITIDQGSLINIIAQSDLVFPNESALAKQRVIQ